jgi:hypothetical protein
MRIEIRTVYSGNSYYDYERNVECMYECSVIWSLYVTCLRYWSLLNTKCNVLEYRRRHSVCYSGLFTTSLVVTTISFYNVLWPSDVVSPGGPGSSALVLWSSLICAGLSLDLLLLSAFCDLLVYLPLFLFCCPWSRVSAPRKEYTFL